MMPVVTEDGTAETRGRKNGQHIFVCLLMISSLLLPVKGFALRACRITSSSAVCAGMKLRAVPRDIPSTVTCFDLSVNKISKVQVSDFQNLPVLTQLDLNRNLLSQIDNGSFSTLTSLRKFNLNNNKLVELREDLFVGLSNLTELRISSNRIKTVASTSFRSMKSLTFLDISHNKLQHITRVHFILQHLPHLRELNLKNNDITTFHSWELTNSSVKLKSIDLSQNPIKYFSITSDVFPNLTWFNVGGSPRKQQMIWDVQNKTFFGRVLTLDASGLQMAFHDMETLIETVNASLTSLRMNAMKNYLRPLINMSCTIPTMSSLQLRRNKLTFVNSDLFKLCFRLTELDLTENKIRIISDDAFRSLQRLRILSLSCNRLSSVPAATRNRSLVELDLSFNNITKLGCEDFLNQTTLQRLYLHQNPITALKECVFKDLTRLQILKLQNTRMSKLNGAFRRSLPNLRQLLLNGNELTSLKFEEFRGLQSLQNLSLHENKIGELENGCFVGLTNLTDILLQNNLIKSTEINKGVFNDLTNLRRLDLRDNHIRYENDSALPHAPFSQLFHLEMLAIPSQHHKGKSHLPRNFLQGLTNLLVFNTRDFQLLSLHKDMFNDTPQLQKLDISSNELKDLSPDLFLPIQNLKSLYISRTNLLSLDYLTNANLTKLQFLQAKRNQFSVISEEIIMSLPALIYADFQGNSFSCVCDNAWFLHWAKSNNQTQVFDAYNFECNYPVNLKGMKLLDDVHFCSVDKEFVLFISTTCTILLFMMVSFTYHFLRWNLVYAYYLFLALLFDTKHKNKQAPNQYDAFISYNIHDEPWVFEELLPKLEGEQGWRLCLHHRDFEPGKSIIENITDAIYGSRKTLCVISRRYLQSEWCSREIQMASFRLFDEKKDVLILVFLEEIPTCELSPHYRMRKLLSRQTYLSWPRAAEHTQLFWEKLRQVLKTRDEDSFQLTVVDWEW